MCFSAITRRDEGLVLPEPYRYAGEQNKNDFLVLRFDFSANYTIKQVLVDAPLDELRLAGEQFFQGITIGFEQPGDIAANGRLIEALNQLRCKKDVVALAHGPSIGR